MTNNEKILLQTYLDEANIYLEYGCGNSTILASQSQNISKIISIDSSCFWISKISKEINNPNNKEILFNYVDIDADDTNWGWPKTKIKQYNWALYSSLINNYNDKIDTILVDGRFRVACAMQCCHNMSSNSIMMVHDYHRNEYHIIEQYFTKIEQIDSLAIFQKKHIDTDLIIKIYNEYKLVPN